jgi:hypothetical protein
MNANFAPKTNQRSSYFSQFIFYNIIWWAMYAFVYYTVKIKANKKIQLEIKTRIVPIFHGLFATFMSLNYILKNGFDFTMPANSESDLILFVSLTYFIHDGIVYAYIGFMDKKLFLHHLITISCIVYTLTPGNLVTPFCIALFLAESSNFAMNIRSILFFLNLKFTIIYEIFDIIYLSFYLVCRGLIAPFYIYRLYIHPEVPLMFVLFGLAIFLQSVGFMKIMIIIIKKKILNYQTRKSKGIPYWWFNINPKLLELDYIRKKIESEIF